MLYQQPLPTVIREISFSVLTRLCTKLMPIPVIVEESRSGVLPDLSFNIDLISYKFYLIMLLMRHRFDNRHDVKNAVFQCLNSTFK